MQKLILLLCFVIGTNHSIAQTGQYVPELAIIDAKMQEFMTSHNVAGLSIAMTYQDRLIYARGFGYANVEDDILVEPYHSFRIASISKPITSSAIFKLIDDNQLALTDKVFGVNGILNDAQFLNINDSKILDIEIGHLLSHTSGWYHYTTGLDPMFLNLEIAAHYNMQAPVYESTIIQYVLENQALSATPGTTQWYSNFSYMVLGEVIEKITGLAYEQYVRNEFLNPLGISQMQLGQNLTSAANEVKYYHPVGGLPSPISIYDDGQPVTWPYGGFNLEAMDGHGAWIATPTELCRYILSIDGVPSFPDILSSGSVQKMHTRPFSNAQFGHGWQLHSNPNFWLHHGVIPGSTGFFWKGQTVNWAILVNHHDFSDPTYLNDLDNAIFQGIQQVTNFPNHDLFSQVLSVKEQEDFKLKLYPNPSKDYINISFPEPNDYHIAIYDIMGKELMRKTEFHSEITTVNTSELPKGVYFIKIELNAKILTKKIIIE